MIREKKWILISSIMLALLCRSENGIAQSLTGVTGLINIPTAEISRDREVYFGLNWADYSLPENDPYNQYDKIAIYVTLGYLPFLEVSPRLTEMLDYPESQAIGDRMVSVKLRLFSENAFFPSIALGAHDFLAVFGGLGRSNYFNALYLTASKAFRVGSFLNEFHIGYGTDWIKARQHQFVGLFGGISLSPRPFVAFMLEHDSERLNCGMRISVLDHIEFLAALLDFDTFSGGVSYRFGL